ncbi:MAG: DUF4912 domain-containing protein [Polyangiaceae bacterium]
MNRAELDALSRDDLIQRAEALSIAHARTLTRAELVDEILKHDRDTSSDAVRVARGFFGIARDLLARVVERGLHLPDAAARFLGSAPPPKPRTVGGAIPTVTLAEIYASQGHRDRAIETASAVLADNPENNAARELLDRLRKTPPAPPVHAPVAEEAEEIEAAEESVSPTRPSEPPTEPTGMLDDEPLPSKYDVDECVALPVDETTIFVYWEVRETTLSAIVDRRGQGILALRVIIVTPTWDGPEVATRDIDVHSTLGNYYLRDLPPRAVVRVALGYRQGDVFLPIRQSPAIEQAFQPPMEGHEFVRWTPAGFEPVLADSDTSQAVARARSRLRSARRHDGSSGESYVTSSRASS